MRWRILLCLVAIGAGFPLLKLPKITQHTNEVFIATTAYDMWGIESDYSTELPFFYTTNRSVTVGWSEPISDVTGYSVYWGTNSGTYIHFLDAGPNLEATIPLVAPVTNYGAVYAQHSLNSVTNFSDMSLTPIYRWTNSTTNGQEFFRLRIQQQTTPIP